MFSNKKAMTALYVVLGPVLLILYTNASSTGDSSFSSNNKKSFKSITVAQIESEYSKVYRKIYSGKYGVKGGKMMKNHLVLLGNAMSKKVKAKSCADIRGRIAKLETNYYLIQGSHKKNKYEKCLSNAIITMVSSSVVL